MPQQSRISLLIIFIPDGRANAATSQDMRLQPGKTASNRQKPNYQSLPENTPKYIYISDEID
jgi:hypothetical protein